MIMGNFYFQRANAERILLGEGVNEHEAMALMQKFLDEHNYKSYYTRSWLEGNTKWYDVGSHIEFFVFVEGS